MAVKKEVLVVRPLGIVVEGVSSKYPPAAAIMITITRIAIAIALATASLFPDGAIKKILTDSCWRKNTTY